MSLKVIHIRFIRDFIHLQFYTYRSRILSVFIHKWGIFSSSFFFYTILLYSLLIPLLLLSDPFQFSLHTLFLLRFAKFTCLPSFISGILFSLHDSSFCLHGFFSILLSFLSFPSPINHYFPSLLYSYKKFILLGFSFYDSFSLLIRRLSYIRLSYSTILHYPPLIALFSLSDPSLFPLPTLFLQEIHLTRIFLLQFFSFDSPIVLYSLILRFYTILL